jgi:hypothetical protein
VTAAHLALLRATWPQGIPTPEEERMSAPGDVLREDFDHRLGFHPADTDLKRKAHETVRKLMIEAASAVAILLPPGREKSLFATSVQEATMWANAALALGGGPREGLTESDLDDLVAGVLAEGSWSYSARAEEGSRPL